MPSRLFRLAPLESLGRQWPLAVGFILLLVIAATSVWLVSDNRRQGELVLHTQQVQTRTYRLLALVEDAETGQRGFLLTGNESYLDRYGVGSTAAQSAIDDLIALTADNEVQQREFGKLRPVVGAKLAELAQTIDLKRHGEGDAALAIVNTDLGRNMMQQIRASIDRVLGEENRLLAKRVADADSTEVWLLGVTLGGVALVIALALLAIIGVRRNTAALEDAQAALRSTNENLEAMVDARTLGLREANDEIQRFAYIVSHDLRAPLVNIMGFTSELEAVRSETSRRLAATSEDEATKAEDARIDGDFGEALGFIKASTTKMDGLINAILRLSREGRRSFRPEKLDVTEIATTVADSLRHQCVEQGAVIEIAPRLPGITADRLAVEQILTNLIENAVKYLVPDRPGRIEVTGRDAAAGMVVYEVSDNGRGIERHDNERIFELFRRAGAQDRTGEGIGLAHVRALVRRLGGSVVCQSTPGKGSIFRLTLPKVARAEPVTEDVAA